VAALVVIAGIERNHARPSAPLASAIQGPARLS
jgi:hypothetical protein